MAINYTRVADEIIKIARGLGYDIQMFDEFGSGPISSSKKAKYIYLKPDGIIFSMPSGAVDEHEEIFIYVGNKKDINKFLNLVRRVRIVARFNALGITIRKFNTDVVTPKHFADEARSRLEDKQEE